MSYTKQLELYAALIKITAQKIANESKFENKFMEVIDKLPHFEAKVPREYAHKYLLDHSNDYFELSEDKRERYISALIENTDCAYALTLAQLDKEIIHTFCYVDECDFPIIREAKKIASEICEVHEPA